MLKTNNKEVKNYFIDLVKSDFEEEEQKQSIIDYFNCCDYEQRALKDKSITEVVKKYFYSYDGSYLYICYEDMKNILKEALQETEEEADQYSNDKIADLFFNLYTRALTKVFNFYLEYSEKHNFYFIRIKTE